MQTFFFGLRSWGFAIVVLSLRAPPEREWTYSDWIPGRGGPGTPDQGPDLERRLVGIAAAGTAPAVPATAAGVTAATAVRAGRSRARPRILGLAAATTAPAAVAAASATA